MPGPWLTGTGVQTYSYGPFGETTGSGSENNPFQYAGRENDGSSLYYNRARYYRPEWGRFISEDPIGVLGGLNQYRYSGNNPLAAKDPSGLTETSVTTPQGYAEIAAMAFEEAAQYGGAIAATSWWTGWTGRWVRHHLFPQAFRPNFTAIGIRIDDWLMRMPLWAHQWLHRKGFHQAGGWWNSKWQEFFNYWGNKANWPGGIEPSAEQMRAYAREWLQRLLREAGLSGVPLAVPAVPVKKD